MFKNGTVVTGDGKTLLKNGHVIVEQKIVEVTETDPSAEQYAEEIVDCTGKQYFRYDQSSSTWCNI